MLLRCKNVTTRKRTQTACRFRTDNRSQAVSHLFRKNLHPFEQLGRSIQNGSQAVQTAVSSVHKNCLTVRTASVPVQKNLHPFKRFGHPFTEIVHLLRKIVYPFERLWHPFRKILIRSNDLVIHSEKLSTRSKLQLVAPFIQTPWLFRWLYAMPCGQSFAKRRHKMVVCEILL